MAEYSRCQSRHIHVVVMVVAWGPALTARDSGGLHDWTRYWAARDDSVHHDGDDFVIAPTGPLGVAANPALLTLVELTECQCMILLGEPGLGKSTTINQWAGGPGAQHGMVPDCVINLATFNDVTELRQALDSDERIRSWRHDGQGLCLWLDSLDEAQLHMPKISHSLQRHFAEQADNLAQLRLRIVSRTAEWPLSFEHELMGLFGPENVRVIELLPLTRADISLAANARGVSAESFLDQVTKVGAGALAARPLTLALLLSLYVDDEPFSDRKEELFEQGCRRLCSRVDDARRESIPTGAHQLDVDELITVAARLAAVTQLGAFEGVALAVADKASERFVKPSMLTGGRERVRRASGVDDAVDIDEQSIVAVVRTGLFSSRGPGLYGWTDRRFADYLCARYLTMVRDIGAERVALLLTVDSYGERRVAPQLASLAVWCAQLDENFMSSLFASDPDLVVSERMQIPEAVRPAIVASLLEACDHGRLTERHVYTRQYSILAHERIAEQLAAVISDQTKAERAREVAMHIAEACAVEETTDELLAVALDRQEPYHLRVVAAHGVSKMGTDEQRCALLILLAQADDDPIDDLRGCVLQAVWPDHIDAKSLFDALTSAKQKNLLGLYRSFVYTLEGSGVPREAVGAALTWVADSPWAWLHLGPFDGLVGRILADAVLACDDMSVCSSLANVLVAMCESSDAGLTRGFETYRDAVRSHEDLRRLLAAAVVERVTSDGANVFLVVWRLRLLWNEDVLWMLEQATAAAVPALRAAWLDLVARMVDPSQPGHAAALLSACNEIEGLRERMAGWLDPVALNSEQADARRERERILAESEVSEGGTTQDVAEQGMYERVLALLDQCELGHPDVFARLVFELDPSPRDLDYKGVMEPDLRKLDGWPTEHATVERIVSAARTFLLTQEAESEKWLGTSQLHGLALAGYKALRILLDQDPGFLRDNGARLFPRWTAIVVAFPLSWDDPGGGYRAQLITMAYEHSPVQVLECVEALVRKESQAGLAREPLRVLDSVCDARCEAMLLRLAGESELPVDTRGAVIHGLVVTHGSERGSELAQGSLAGDLSGEQARRLACHSACALLRRDAANWSVIWELMQRDPEFGRALVSEVSFREEFNETSYTDALPPDAKAFLYTWTLQEYPPEEDEDTDGMVTARQRIGWWRNALLQRLKDEGTQGAVEAVQRMRESLPQLEWLARVELEAKDALRRRAWRAFTPSELLRLVEDERARSVVTHSDLLDVLVAALKRIQTDLTRAETPGAQFLWDDRPDGSARPKAEASISDWLKRELENQMGGRRIVVNREVEVHRHSGKGLGHRTDIHVDAVGDGEVIKAIVEVKGCWNDGVERDMKEQLIDDYLMKTGCPAGLYVVGWFGCADRRSCPGRSGLCRRMDPEDARAHLADQASVLSMEKKLDVRSLVIDIAKP